jgi:NitT/TauT family transport system substrate-binding protein
VAYEKGFYKEFGIDLEMVQGGPHRSSSEALEKEEVTFATMWLCDAIQRKSKGVKLVNIAQIVQRSALMLVAKKARGISKPEDINGKKMSLWRADFQIQPRAFIKKYNLNVKIIPQSYTINLFLRDGVNVASAMWYNEYHTIINAGIDPEELTAFFFYEHGLNFPEDGIYTLEKNVNNDPGLVKAFAKASVKGWLYAFENQNEALEIVMKYMKMAKVPVNRVHQKWMLDRMKDIVMPRNKKDPPIGVLRQQDFSFVAGELHSMNLIRNIPDFSGFYLQDVSYAEK